MPIKDMPFHVSMDASTAAEADRIASDAVRLLGDELDRLEEERGRPMIAAVGIECVAAQLNLLAEKLAKRRTYTAPLTDEMKHAELLSLILSDVMDRALVRRAPRGTQGL